MCIRDRLVKSEKAWVLELVPSGDVTMEQLAARARIDLFVEVFGHELIIRAVGVDA